VVHERLHGLQARHPTVRRRPGPAGAGTGEQSIRGSSSRSRLAGRWTPNPGGAGRLRRLVDPDRSARPRGPQALRVQHG
jgi:hypothetical protein